MWGVLIKKKKVVQFQASHLLCRLETLGPGARCSSRREEEVYKGDLEKVAKGDPG